MKICVFAILLLLTGCADAQPRGAAVRLDLAEGVCSGVAVGPNLVLTASHCLEGNRIKAINGQPAYALKAIHDGKDHALVRVSMKFKRWAKVGGSPLTGDRVSWTGNPAGQDMVYREGYISRVYHNEVWAQAEAFGGDSGSGVFCPDGRVCGVVSAGKIWTRGLFTFQVMVMYPLAFDAQDWKAIADESGRTLTKDEQILAEIADMRRSTERLIRIIDGLLK